MNHFLIIHKNICSVLIFTQNSWTNIIELEDPCFERDLLDFFIFTPILRKPRSYPTVE
jgi:hypothetical protein